MVGGSFSRIQFTPDLVPADIVGTRIYRQGREQFDIELGPVMANFVLADEINRAPAKVQSALLEVMAERHVSIGGTTYTVPTPFLVLATQNPIEQRGRLSAARGAARPVPAEDPGGLPDRRRGARDHLPDGRGPAGRRTGARPRGAVALQRSAAQVFVHHALVDYVVRLVLATRRPGRASACPTWPGGSPTAPAPGPASGIVAAARALALLRGRDYVLPQDVLDVAADVLRTAWCSPTTRLADGVPVGHIVTRVLQTVPLPQVPPAASRGWPRAAGRGCGPGLTARRRRAARWGSGGTL